MKVKGKKMIVYECDCRRKLTAAEESMLKMAEKRTVVFDEDSPEYTDEELACFRKVYDRKNKKELV